MGNRKLAHLEQKKTPNLPKKVYFDTPPQSEGASKNDGAHLRAINILFHLPGTDRGGGRSGVGMGMSGAEILWLRNQKPQNRHEGDLRP